MNTSRECKQVGQVVIAKQRSFQNLHQIPILCSIYRGLQFVCVYLVSLFDFISAKKLRHANYNEIPTRSTRHVSRERAVLDLIALRKHDTQRLLLICAKKKNPSLNLYVIGIPLNKQTISIFFLTMQFHRSQACDPRACLTAICK